MAQDVRQEAIEWRIRLAHGGTPDWEAFAIWLEANPAHSVAYDEVALADSALDPQWIPASSDTSDHEVEGSEVRATVGMHRLPWAAVAAVAALVLLVLAFHPTFHFGSSRYEVASAAGTRKSVDLGDGSRAELNGATRLVLDRADPRFAELTAGEAAFFVRHDQSNPFTLALGDDRIQDVGTGFNAVRRSSDVAVEVFEGRVLYNPGREAISLAAGQTLAIRAGDDRAIVGRKDPGAMAGWRRNLLSYSSAPLGIVAEDLTRSLGATVRVDRQIATQPFTGSIKLEADRVATVRRLASILDLSVRQDSEGWLIEPRQPALR